jgi:hypothetical protein
MPVRAVRLRNVSISAKNAGTVKGASGVTFENVRTKTPSGEPLKTIRVQDFRLEISP